MTVSHYEAVLAAVFTAQLVAIVSVICLLLTSSCIVWSILEHASRFWLVPWLCAIVLHLISMLGYSITWWAGHVEGYWVALTTFAFLSAGLDIYFFLCIFSYFISQGEAKCAAEAEHRRRQNGSNSSRGYTESTVVRSAVEEPLFIENQFKGGPSHGTLLGVQNNIWFEKDAQFVNDSGFGSGYSPGGNSQTRDSFTIDIMDRPPPYNGIFSNTESDYEVPSSLLKKIPLDQSQATKTGSPRLPSVRNDNENWNGQEIKSCGDQEAVNKTGEKEVLPTEDTGNYINKVKSNKCQASHQQRENDAQSHLDNSTSSGNATIETEDSESGQHRSRGRQRYLKRCDSEEQISGRRRSKSPHHLRMENRHRRSKHYDTDNETCWVQWSGTGAEDRTERDDCGQDWDPAFPGGSGEEMDFVRHNSADMLVRLDHALEYSKLAREFDEVRNSQKTGEPVHYSGVVV
jgi:hypothetical protein